MMRGVRASFLLRRMGAARLLLGSMLLAILVTAALAAALAAFSSRALPQAVRSQLAAVPSPAVAINGQFGAAQAASDTTVIRSSMRAAFGSVPLQLNGALWSDPLGLPASGGQVIPIAEAATLDQLTAHARLVGGSWPGPPQRGQPVGAALPAQVASRLQLRIGQVLSLPDRDTGVPVRLQLTGLFVPRDPGSPYWGLDLLGTSGVAVRGNFATYGPFAVAPAAFSRGQLAVGQASWLLQPDLAAIAPARVGDVAAQVSRAQARLMLPGPLGGLDVTTTIPGLLRGIASNLVVARSLLLISVLELLLLAVVAIALAARMLARERDEESALLSARGVTRWQLARLTLAEAVLLAAAAAVAGTLAGGFLAGPLARVGPLHGSKLAVSGLPVSIWWSAAVILVLCTVIMLWPAIRPAAPGAARIGRGRQARLTGAATAGADAAVVALGALAIWQLHGYSAVARTASGHLGVDPVLVAAPTLALAGAAMIPLRLLPAFASAADRLAARTRWLTGALASWQVSRRPIRQSGPVLLVILAVAAGTLALAQHATWRKTAADQAAFAVGADARVDLAAPVPLGQVAGIQHALGTSAAMPVARFNGGLGGEVIALNSGQAASVAMLRPDQSPVPAAVLWRKITPVNAGPGLALPGRPARLGLTASAAQRSGGPALAPLSVLLSVQDAAGIVYSVPAGSLPADGRTHELTAVLAPSNQASYPLRLLGMSLSYQLPAIPAPPFDTRHAMRAASLAARQAADRQATLTISGLAASPARAGPFPAPFAAGSALAAWHPGAGSADLANPLAHGTKPGIKAWRQAAGGSGVLTFTQGDGYLKQAPDQPPLPISGELTLAAGRPAAVLPAVATKAFLRSSSVSAGSIIFAAVGPVNVPVRIVAVLANFPTAGPGGLLIVDQPAIQEFLASKSAAPLPVSQWWLRTAAAPAGQPPAGATVSYQAQAAAGLLANPLSAAPQQAVLAIAVAAALLAALGFSVSVAASVRDRRTQSAVLAALGVSRAAQAAQLCLEELMLSAPAAVAGVLLGAGVAHLLLPAVTLTTTGTVPVPPPVIVLPLGWAAGLAIVITAIPVLVAAATVARRHDPAAQLRAAEAV